MSIVVTGFGIFGDHESNSSSLAVAVMKSVWDEMYYQYRTMPQITAIKNIPVTYKDVDDAMSLWSADPLLVIHVGLCDSKHILLESQARNKCYSSLDMDSKYCRNECAVLTGPEVLKTGFDLERVKKCLTDKQIMCQISNDPGNYLCGYIYYKSLSIASNRVVFIHVPSENYMPVGDIALGLTIIARELALQRGVFIPEVDLFSKQ